MVLGAASDLNWVPLGRLLVEAGVVTGEQLEQALAVKEATGRRLGEIVVELDFAAPEVIAGALAQQYELEFVDLDSVSPDPAAVAQLPEALAHRYEAIPIRFLSDGVLLLAVSDPTNVAVADDLRLALGSGFRLAVAVRSQIERALARFHRPTLQVLPDGQGDPDLSSSGPTINLVNTLLTKALDEGASDIHFEPRADQLAVRVRVDGVDPSLIAGSLNCVVAQRLARRLCLECRTPVEAVADGQLFGAVGCGSCHGTGYRGRVALREVLPVQGEIRGLVERSAEEFFAAAVRHGMTTLRDDGMRLALAGVTSVDEVRRVTGLRLS